MSMLPFFEWCETTLIGTAIRSSLWLFPTIEVFHLIALAWLGGAVLLVDLRLLGFGFRRQSVARIAADARRWVIGSLVVIIGSGLLLFTSEALKCYSNPAFWIKMTCLVLAVVFTFTVRDRVCRAATDMRPPRWGKLVACVSLALWCGVALMGRGIGFY